MKSVKVNIGLVNEYNKLHRRLGELELEKDRIIKRLWEIEKNIPFEKLAEAEKDGGVK